MTPLTRLPGQIFRPVRALLLPVVAWFAGCAATGGAGPGAPSAAPAAPAQGTLMAADLAGGLRCMDNLLVEFGSREIAVGAGDDAATREQAAVRDALVGAFSDMSRRSRVLRVLTGRAAAPQVVLRSAASVQPGPAGSVRVGLSLSLLSGQDGSVLPGTASRHEALIVGRRAEVQKFGRTYAVDLGGDLQGDSQRALAQFAAMEAVGRLARIPYWTCLGASASDPGLQAEVQDWYDAMTARPAELIGYFQGQLRQRSVYDGPVDGAVNAGFRDAVARYRGALGLSAEPKLTLELFSAHLHADPRALAAKLPPGASGAGPAATPPVLTAQAPQAPSAPPAAPGRPMPQAAQAALTLRVATSAGSRPVQRGEALQLSVRPSRDSHVQCFLQDENRKILRFFPNRWQPDARVGTDAGLQLPGQGRFQIVMNPRGAVETVSCFATERDVSAALPRELAVTADFQPLAVDSLDQVRNAFVRASGGAVAHDSFQLRAR